MEQSLEWVFWSVKQQTTNISIRYTSRECVKVRFYWEYWKSRDELHRDEEYRIFIGKFYDVFQSRSFSIFPNLFQSLMNYFTQVFFLLHSRLGCCSSRTCLLVYLSSLFGDVIQTCEGHRKCESRDFGIRIVFIKHSSSGATVMFVQWWLHTQSQHSSQFCSCLSASSLWV